MRERAVTRTTNMNSKVRCSICKNYVDRADVVWSNNISRICSAGCLDQHFGRQRRSQKATRTSTLPRTARTPKVEVAVRFEVRKRDTCCRFCGARGTQCHHIIYRSQGGPDVIGNLVLLCASCHALVHTSKEAFQPLLLGYLWLLYVEGRKLTIPEVARVLQRLGLLTELQQERLAG